MVNDDKRRRFDPSVRQKAVAMFKEGVKGKEISRQLGVSYPTIVVWKSKWKEEHDKQQPAVDTDIEKELLRLEVEYYKKEPGTMPELERLRIENEYLKKRLAVYER
jgi:transposase-like protein